MKRFLALIMAFCVAGLFAVPDSSGVRAKIVEKWFDAPAAKVVRMSPEIYTNEVGEKFQVSAEASAGEVKVCVAARKVITVEEYNERGEVKKVLTDVYPEDAAGSWVLYRGRENVLRYYATADSEIWLEAREKESQAMVSVRCYDAMLVEGVPVGLPLERLYSASLSALHKWIPTLPWDVLDGGVESRAVRQMAAVVSDKLQEIVPTEDLMRDEDGRTVYVSTGKAFKGRVTSPQKYLGEAGFLKWIADGVVEPLTGGHLKREPLITQTVNYKDTGLQGRGGYNLSFSLDWVRNLSSALISIRTGKNYMYNESGCDVNGVPIAAVVTQAGLERALPYIKDTGYQMAVLKAVLRVLAVREPETIYFAAITTTETGQPKVFNHCCALMPYFDGDGHFQCVVFMDGKQMSVDKLVKMYSGEFISLVRVRSTERFFPE